VWRSETPHGSIMAQVQWKASLKKGMLRKEEVGTQIPEAVDRIEEGGKLNRGENNEKRVRATKQICKGKCFRQAPVKRRRGGMGCKNCNETYNHRQQGKKNTTLTWGGVGRPPGRGTMDQASGWGGR